MSTSATLAASRRTQMTVSGQSVVTYSYDNADRLTGTAQGAASSTFTYDDVGNLTGKFLPNGVVETSSYNNANELVSQSFSGAIGSLAYAYDRSGRVRQVGGPLGEVEMPETFSATYNSANRAASYTLNGTTRSLTYDANGNITADGAVNYTWNDRNELAGISGGGVSASFAYDPLGRRARKTVGTTTTQFGYDGSSIVQEQTSTGTPNANLFRAGGAILSRTDSGGTRSFVTDGGGSTIRLTDPAGAVATSYRYSPHGKSVTGGTPDANPYQAGGNEDDGTGLIHTPTGYYLKNPIGTLPGGITIGSDPRAGRNIIIRPPSPSPTAGRKAPGYNPWNPRPRTKAAPPRRNDPRETECEKKCGDEWEAREALLWEALEKCLQQADGDKEKKQQCWEIFDHGGKINSETFRKCLAACKEVDGPNKSTQPRTKHGPRPSRAPSINRLGRALVAACKDMFESE